MAVLGKPFAMVYATFATGNATGKWKVHNTKYQVERGSCVTGHRATGFCGLFDGTSNKQAAASYHTHRSRAATGIRSSVVVDEGLIYLLARSTLRGSRKLLPVLVPS